MSDSASPPNATGPAPEPWSPTAELKAYTDMLNQAQLSAIGDRSHALLQLKHFSAKHVGTPASQIRACGDIKQLPFFRLPLAMRTDPMNAEFIGPARQYNRELLDAKKEAGLRLRQISNDPALPPSTAQYATRINGRAPLMKVEHGELNEVEIPAQLLPPNPTANSTVHFHNAEKAVEKAATKIAEKAAAKAEAAAAREALAEATRIAKANAEAEVKLKERDRNFDRRVLATICPGDRLNEALTYARRGALIPSALLDELTECTRKFDILKAQQQLPTYRR